MERALLTLGRSRRGLTQEQEAQPSRYSAHPHGPRHAPGSGTAPARLHHAPGPSQPSKREVLVPSVFPPSRKLTLSVTRGSEDHGRTGASMHLPSDSSPFIDWLLSPSPERRLQGHASRTQPRWTPPESSPPKTPSPQVKWGGPVHAPGGLRHFLRHCRCRMSGVQGPPGLVPTLFQPVLLLPAHLHPRLRSRLDLSSAPPSRLSVLFSLPIKPYSIQQTPVHPSGPCVRSHSLQRGP